MNSIIDFKSITDDVEIVGAKQAAKKSMESILDGYVPVEKKNWASIRTGTDIHYQRKGEEQLKSGRVVGMVRNEIIDKSVLCLQRFTNGRPFDWQVSMGKIEYIWEIEGIVHDQAAGSPDPAFAERMTKLEKTVDNLIDRLERLETNMKRLMHNVVEIKKQQRPGRM